MDTLERRIHRAMSLLLITSIILCTILPTCNTTCMAFQSNTLPTSSTMIMNRQRASIYTARPPKTTATTTTIYGFFDEPEELIGQDKLKACIPYVLPLLDGDMFGRYLFERIPPLNFLHELLFAPLVQAFNAQPFLGIILFVLLCIGTRNTDGMSRTVRFNAQQACLIDVALIVPVYMANGMERSGDVPRVFDEIGCNLVYYALLAGVLYSVVSNLNGKKPDEIPFFSGAAEFMVGPF